MTATLGTTIRAALRSCLRSRVRRFPVSWKRAKVITGNGDEYVGGAFLVEETNARGDDEDDGNGAEDDARFHRGK
ncbi:hypothetical protein OCL88_19965 [Paenarthrobacter sp. PAE-2]|uniref:hypothetical protein n=1 Tax=Paenarthrobacter sp. PAE-2 TaxID=2982532 RepID=UPI002230EA57|nr:hypothetical protein [Paenarthrobacter sp. PAE-2]MCW3768753.1 hypothetical protein [Paenarthrobacter sp. PAE-2]